MKETNKHLGKMQRKTAHCVLALPRLASMLWRHSHLWLVLFHVLDLQKFAIVGAGEPFWSPNCSAQIAQAVGGNVVVCGGVHGWRGPLHAGALMHHQAVCSKAPATGGTQHQLLLECLVILQRGWGWEVQAKQQDGWLLSNANADMTLMMTTMI